MDMTHLQRVDPTHVLSRLKLRNLDKAPIRLVLHHKTLERLSTNSNGPPHLTVSASAEVAGYSVALFSHSLESRQRNLKDLCMPRPVPGKPGFVVMVFPDWSTDLKVQGEGNFSKIPKAVDYLERSAHLDSWPHHLA